MSCWTHITACMSVETNIVEENTELMRRVTEYLRDAPKITGSEGPADVFVNIQSGFNLYMSHDCEHCEYKGTLKEVVIKGEEMTECDATDDHDCSAEYQTCVVISVQGDLRDSTTEQTQQEFNKFKDYVSNLGYIRDYALNIEGDI